MADRAVFCRKLANLLKLRHYNKKMSLNYQVFLDYASISGFPLGGTHGNPRAFVKIVRYCPRVWENISLLFIEIAPQGETLRICWSTVHATDDSRMLFDAFTLRPHCFKCKDL